MTRDAQEETMMKHAFAVTLAATLALGLLAACPAVASHYVLSSVDVVEEAMVPRLAAIGIQTTEDLWNQTRTPKQIKKVARKMGVSTAKVKDWHDFCDLLRVRGVGPKVVRVLQLAGVQRLSVLAKEDPARLTTRMKNTNTQYQILGKLPDEESVRAWIQQAQSLVRR